VTFASSAEADRARLEMNGMIVEGRKIEVRSIDSCFVTCFLNKSPGDQFLAFPVS